MTTDPEPDLLAHGRYLRALARSLVRCSHAADDLAQDAMVEALERPPADRGNPRGWLTAVLRRGAFRARRGAERRLRRERLATARPADADDGDRRVRMHAELVQHVLALPQPYREAIALRFFDGLPPRRIAQRLGVPVATVRSRVQRGLQQLRARLERAHGGADDWLPVVAAIGWPGWGAWAIGSGAGALFVMQTKLGLGLAAVAMVGVFFWMRGGDAQGPTPASTALAGAPAGPVRADPLADRTSAAAPDRVAAAEERRLADGAAPEPAADDGLAGRVVDARGTPVAGVRVVAHGRRWPRWQSGDLGWISDGADGAFLPPAQLATLRDDPAARAAALAEVGHPEAWNTVLFGEPFPGEVRTDADGRFALTTVATGSDAELDVLGDDRVLLAVGRGDGGVVLVTAPAFEVRGRVLEQDGTAVVECQVSVEWSLPAALRGSPLKLVAERTWTPRELRPDANGRYLAPTVPAAVPGASLVARAFDGRMCRAPAPVAPTDDYDLVFDTAAAPIGVDGIVFAADGTPLTDAAVRFGRAATATAADGSFRFDELPAEDSASLTVLAEEHAPLQLDSLCGAVRADPQRGQGLELRLQRALRLRGVVVDAAQRPLPGLQVNLFDPTLLDVTFTPVEGAIGAWQRGVTTDAQGRFALTGLAPRAYRLRVWRPDQAFVFVSAPLTAGRDDVVVRVPKDAVHDTVRGTVRAADGDLPADLTVAVGYPIHVIKDGDGCMTEGTAPAPVGRDGAFTLRGVPRRHAYLSLTSDGATVAVPVEAIDADGRVTVDLGAPTKVLEFVVRGVLDAGTTVSVLDGDDRPLPVTAFMDGRRVRATELAAVDGLLAPVVVPDAARAVLVRRADGGARRVAIVADSVLLRALVP
ncbi:MAG: sigma-70 family RNA polymerase sigma factor [Planctomycetota bacterium]